GYGRDVSRFAEQKRSVRDKDIGPLISTDMTRCIHCTRCVRFGEEICGMPELGTLGRGEDMEIGTFVEQSVDHELSGNNIDLCPVGALNSRPFRFRARNWEMQQVATVSAHDCLGSNLYAHVKNGKWLRTVPRPNDAINETWISDRDRFAYEGLQAEDRLTQPMRQWEGVWRSLDWRDGLDAAAKIMRSAAQVDQLGFWVSSSTTCEEGWLLSELTKFLGCTHIDYQLRQIDHELTPSIRHTPYLGDSLTDFENHDAMVLVGSQLRTEVPMLAHRVRQAALKGCAVMTVSPIDDTYYFPVTDRLSYAERGLLSTWAGVAAAVRDLTGRDLPDAWLALGSTTVTDTHRAIAQRLIDAERPAIVLGLLANADMQLNRVRAVTEWIAEATQANIAALSPGANSLGLQSLLGRDAGRRWRAMLGDEQSVVVLFGVEPEGDAAWSSEIKDQLTAARVIAITPYLSDAMREYVDIALPLTPYAETAGSFVNALGNWQSFPAVMPPMGESKPGWKV
ncbi:MAG: molybdopterin-dependent oxidoreductase, partial [Gammaproteobacteria bacterium]|nr:molybdopterin-dependent oxidoreductase [Gammaproteobacteria bacterium]